MLREELYWTFNKIRFTSSFNKHIKTHKQFMKMSEDLKPKIQKSITFY